MDVKVKVNGGCVWRVSSKDEFEDGDQGGDLAYPEKEHPFDDFRLEIRPVLLGHEAFGEIIFLLPESQFQAFRDGASFLRLNLGSFQNGENLCCAHNLQN